MIIVLTGANDFAIRQAAQQISTEMVNKFGIHAFERVDGETLEPNRLAELLQAASLFATERLVLLSGASKNKPLWEALGGWVDRVPAEVTLIIVESAPDKRTRTYKRLQKSADFRNFPELSEPHLATWVRATAAELGGNIDVNTIHHLLQLAGSDQWRLRGELEKLVAHNPIISPAAIDELVEPTTQASAFELLDSALGKRVQRTAELIAKLKISEDPYKLFGLMVSQIHTLALVVSGAGRAPDTIAKEAGVHPFVVRKLQPLAKTTTLQQLQAIIAIVAQTDRQLKTTGADPWVLLEQALGKVASRG